MIDKFVYCTLTIFLSLSLIPQTTATEFALTVEVPPGKFQCFFQSIDNPKHKFIEIDYQVIDGGDLNINFMTVIGAEILIQEVSKREGNHKIQIKSLGEYQLCFDNTFSYQSRKVVFFELFLLDENGDMSEEELSRMNQNDPIMKKQIEQLGMHVEQFRSSFEKIKQALNKVEYHQALLRAYESRDRAIMGANLNRVNLWSTINTVVIAFVGCLQVFMIKSLFNENSKLGRLLRKT
uniref:GOLD domain-containing protein n=1 Tax=Parastrongyloides trichosuri TaxID=131310 RepID=A0A0N5A328_PARTI